MPGATQVGVSREPDGVAVTPKRDGGVKTGFTETETETDTETVNAPSGPALRVAVRRALQRAA